MAGRGPRTGGRHQLPDAARHAPEAAQAPEAAYAAEAAYGVEAAHSVEEADVVEAADRALVRISDLAGRPRGTGFVADHQGTVITSHEAVDGLARLVLHAPGDRTCLVTADSVTLLPSLNLALIHLDGLGNDGLGLAPLPITVRDSVESGTYVRIAAGGWREARVLGGTSAVTYTATDRFHLLDDALELAIGTAGSDALRLGGGAAGGPVIDAATGAVVAVLGTALHSGRRVGGFAVPLSAGRMASGSGTGSGPGSGSDSGSRSGGALAELLARNAATVPAYGDDLNLAGVLELAATVEAQPGSGEVDPVERADAVRELRAFLASPYAVLGLVGAPGSGRTTELAALSARRDRGPEPAPTLWLRGADLLDADSSVADAARRALERAGRIVAASASGSAEEARGVGTWAPSPEPGPSGGEIGELGDIRPERLARLARDAGRPLLLLLDSPEEMPPALAHRLSEWTEGTAEWLRAHGVRLVVACRAEYWEWAGAEFPRELLYGSERGGDEAPGGLPACVRLGDLDEGEARRARARYGVPEGALDGPDARHPLMLRLLSEVRAAMSLPAASDERDEQDGPVGPVERDESVEPVARDEVFAAYLDLMCLRVAVRLAAANGLRGTAVRRLAARVSGQVHAAARRCLGPGQGELDRAAFESVFPWGPVPDRRLGGCTGWASAVLTEGLLVPAGDGYRFAHEELADWIQGMHLDLDTAFRALVHHEQRDEPESPYEPEPPPVPRHRIGPVLHALLLLPRQQGDADLTLRLRELLRAVDELEAMDAGSWWATRLLSGVLLRVPDATPYVGVLRHLAERVVTWRAEGRAVPGEFGPVFWTRLPLPEAHRFDLLRRLVVADEAPPATERRYLDAVSGLLAADPAATQPHLTHWFEDERPLPATPDATVATAAQALLHTHRRRALDDLTEALAESAHPRADELLAVLAEEEPSAVCRAVDRWTHDERPARRAAAMTHGLRAAPHVRTEADRELLRYAALFLLARPGDCTLHGAALALLVRDPHTRARHLPGALARFRAGDPRLPASALTAALETHPEPVLAAFGDRLREPDTGEALRTLAEVTTPALARRVAVLVRDVVERRPEAVAHVAAYVDRRLEHGPAARSVLYPLVTGLLDGGRPQLRAALAEVFAEPGTPVAHPLRREFLDLLLTREHDPAVLDALVRAAAEAAVRSVSPGGQEHTRALVHSAGLLLVRTPDGATVFDRALLDQSRRIPGFAALVAGWLADAPEDWSTLVGPSTRRMIENLTGARVPV
ncbi:trypsin-like peptidase domain-containing protein [Streptomyces phaeochromogenes]|uniref:trypsin-like peptidase domain-containing protein n=1 Tax=Streptomyces phaeochromogenes TaxID=1923 RepID=UPI002DD7D606|nr:trypsin-like peptidase domain-containing protein [Streptomyces phaeochromogenes]WRZ29021.1 serine protease [Streptomyces phaeochromogenes]